MRRLHQSALIAAVFVVALASTPSVGSVSPGRTPQATELLVRVVDIGAGLCTVTRVPSDSGFRYFVFDAGSTVWQTQECFLAIDDIVEGDDIELFIVSHPDTDHLSNADELLDRFNVAQIIRTGHERPLIGNWDRFDKHVEMETGAVVTNLRDGPLVQGTQIQVGDATVTLVAGWHDPPAGFGTLSEPEKLNSISIVARLDFAGRSVLFAGDTVGRDIGGPDDECEVAEDVMVQRHDANEVSLRSNVLIAAHHGADNGSSSCFIERVFGAPGNRVVPRFVIFSAGHVTSFAHPREGAAERFRQFGGLGDRFMLRTDRGDTEPDAAHWDDPAAPTGGCRDGRGDDTIDIIIDSQGQVDVDYLAMGIGPCL